MPRLYKTFFVLTLGLLVGCLAFGPVADAENNDQEARKAKILENLKHHFPQIGQANPTMGAFEPSGFDGLDKGSFNVAGRGGAQTVYFLVSADDTKLYLVNNAEPLDVSLTSEQREAAAAEAAAQAAMEAQERKAEIDAAIADEPFLGNADAVVTIVEFSDFECPYCTRGAATVKQILEKYPNDVKFVFQHYPLGFHPWARPAAIASECVADQDADVFWKLHDMYFDKQGDINVENVMDKTREFLDGTGIDIATWTACAEDTDSEAHKAAAAEVTQEMNWGQSMGVSGTPGFFVNGQFLNGAQPLDKFEPIIENAKKNAG